MTEISDEGGSYHLTLAGSPYKLMGVLTIGPYDSNPSGTCIPTVESLTIDPGVTVDLNGYDIQINGGALSADGAILIGTNSSIDILINDAELCGTNFKGQASINNSIVTGIKLTARDESILTATNSTFQNADGYDGRIQLQGDSDGTFANNHIDAKVWLNNNNFVFSGNSFSENTFYINNSDMAPNYRMTVVDGISHYTLTETLTLWPYDLDPSTACTLAPGSLTIDSGVTIDFNRHDIHLYGSVLSADGASFVGTGPYEGITIEDRYFCNTYLKGQVSISNSTVTDINLTAEETSTLTVTNSTIQHADGYDNSGIFLAEDSNGSFANNIIDAKVYLNNNNFVFSENFIVENMFYISSYYMEPNYHMTVVDGISHYTLAGSLTIGTYDSDPSNPCVPTAESLTIDSGVTVYLNGQSLVINGGVLSADGASFVGTDVHAEIHISDTDRCGTDFKGQVSINNSTVTDIKLSAYEESTLTVTNSDLLGIDGQIVINNSSTNTVDARNNFWGCSSGPNTSGCVDYSGNVNTSGWVASAYDPTYYLTEIQLAINSIRAYSARVVPLGSLPLASPIQIPASAEIIVIDILVSDANGNPIPNANINIGLENGLRMMSQEYSARTDANGALAIVSPISASLGETATLISGYLSVGQAMGSFIAAFSTLQNHSDVTTVPVVIELDALLNETERSQIQALAANGEVLIGPDLATVLSEATQKSIALDVNAQIQTQVNQGTNTNLQSVMSGCIENCGFMVTLPPAKDTINFMASNSSHILNEVACAAAVVEADSASVASAGLATVAAGPAVKMACTPLVVGLAADAVNAVAADLRDCDLISANAMDAVIATTGAVSLTTSVVTRPGNPRALTGQLISATEFVTDLEKAEGECNYFSASSNQYWEATEGNQYLLDGVSYYQIDFTSSFGDLASLTMATSGARSEDLIWWNNSTGVIVIWHMKGATLLSQGYPPGLADLSFSPMTAGDYNGDSKTDLLWRSPIKGQNRVWLLDGDTRMSSGALPNLDSNWEIGGSGDLDGDGNDDLVWRHSTLGQNRSWLLNGTSRKQGNALPNLLDTAWEVGGLGDFDGDGVDDILWRNTVLPRNRIWLMNGFMTKARNAIPNLQNNWEVVGTGDFNGDGNADILWRDQGLGQNRIWLMNGLSRKNSNAAPNLTPDWEVGGIGDIDGDGKDDIAWRNTSTGHNRIWLMDGFARKQGAAIKSWADLDWEIVGVGEVD